MTDTPDMPSTPDAPDSADPLRLIDRYLDDDLSPDEVAQLNAWIKSSSANAALFADKSMIHARLADVLTHADPSQAELAPADTEAPLASLPIQRARDDRVGRSYSPYAAAAVLLLVAGIAASLLWRADSNPTQPATTQSRTVTVTLTDARGAVWGAGSLDADTGVGPIDAGTPLTLDAGVAEIVLDSGAVVKLAGPTELTVTGANSARLSRGRVVAFVPESAHGFCVDTPDMRVTDLGTRFGVRVDPAGASDVQVFEGHVHVRGGPAAAAIDRELAVGQGLRTDGGKVEDTVATSEQAFLDRAPLTEVALPATDASAEVVRRAGPLAYWRFETTDSLVSPNAMGDTLTARLRGDATVDAGGVTFGERGDGVVTVGDPIAGLMRGDYTMELWVRPSGSLSGMIAVQRVGDGHAAALMLTPVGARPGFVRFVHRIPAGLGGGQELFSPEPLTPEQWHHLVAVRRGTRLVMYVDGHEVASTSNATGSIEDSVQMHLGRRMSDTLRDARAYVGRVDEVAVYPHALTADAVYRHYAAVRYAR
ncbi:MAG: hypothetical protein GC159_05920 [Phycisphaera sp.]|nr:hypothetical protein [Phycisphaera sp.]